MTANRLSTSQLRLSIAQRTLVDQLDWQVAAGECWCVIGKNGAGKSTLLRTLSGLRAAEKGSVSLNGKELSTWSLLELAKHRSYLPQSRHDAFGYSVLETVLAARHPYHDAHYWESESDIQLAISALAHLDVAELASRDIRSLSGGERQRVAIAALLAQDADLLLLDEPTTGLDLSHQVSVMRLLAQLCRDQARSVVMASHDINLTHQVASHALLLMGDGRYISGKVSDVMTAQHLSDCLGHPIARVVHDGQTIFLAR